MSSKSKVIRVATLLLFSTVLWGQSSLPDPLHSLVPLGAEAYDVQGEKWQDMLTLLVTAEDPQFEGVSRHTVKNRDQLYSAEGKQLEMFPGRVSFRITATYRARFMEPSPFPIGAQGNANDYLLGLKFRVVVFHALRQTVLKPDVVEMIGVPGEVPYDERIFRLTVDLSHVPLTDRVVLEIHDPNGGRICKFHLDLL